MDTFRLEVREPTKIFIEHLNNNPPLRVPGTAVVRRRIAKGVPLALSHNVRCNHVLYESVLLVAVTTTETPRVSDEGGVVVTPIADGITRVELRFGFMEQPDVPKALEAAMARGQIAKCDLSRVIYYTGHETIIPSGRRPGLARWREELFAFMHHNAQRPGASFRDSKLTNHRNRRRIRDLSSRGLGSDPMQRAGQDDSFGVTREMAYDGDMDDSTPILPTR